MFCFRNSDTHVSFRVVGYPANLVLRHYEPKLTLFLATLLKLCKLHESTNYVHVTRYEADDVELFGSFLPDLFLLNLFD
jgi:hypothetical protein